MYGLVHRERGRVSLWSQSCVGHAAAGEPDEWVVTADLDELHLYPEPLPMLISSAEAEGSNNIRGTMVNMLAEDGGLPPLPPPDGDLWALFPRRCALTRKL